MLESRGALCVTAQSIGEALDAIRGQSFDLVVLDWFLPPDRGDAIFDAMVAIRPDIWPRVCILSGMEPDDAGRAFVARTGVAWVTKVFSEKSASQLLRQHESVKPGSHAAALDADIAQLGRVLTDAAKETKPHTAPGFFGSLWRKKP